MHAVNSVSFAPVRIVRQDVAPMALCAALIALSMMLITGCSAAPLVRPAPAGGPSAYEDMPYARVLDVQTDDGVTLRGLYVPPLSDDTPAEQRDLGNAPLVLHLLPSGLSIASGVPIGVGRIGLASTLNAFAAAGYASVVFDYRGMGRSDGVRNAGRLAVDGHAMWHEALRLADGQPERIVIRGASLGTLVAAQLLDDGVRPAGVILYTPLRAQSITRHAARARFGPVGAIFSGLYRAPVRADLVHVVQRSDVPMLLVMPSTDEFISDPERNDLAAAAEAAGHRVVRYEGDHQETNLRAWGFRVDRRSLSGRSVSSLPAFEHAFLAEVRGTAEPLGSKSPADHE